MYHSRCEPGCACEQDLGFARRWTDVVDLDQVRVAVSRPPQNQPPGVTAAYRDTPGIEPIAELADAPAGRILPDFSQYFSDGEVKGSFWILPQRQESFARCRLEDEASAHNSSARSSTS